MDYHSAGNPPAITQNNITLLILILIALLCFSALFSAAEVAFFSLNSRDLNILRARQNRNARTAGMLLEKPGLLQACLIMVGCLLNISFILIANFLAGQMLPFRATLIGSLAVRILLITSALLLFAQVLPRIYATRNSLRTALFTAPMLKACRDFLGPLVNLYDNMSRYIEEKFSPADGEGMSFRQIDEAITSTVNESATEEERNILKGIVEFGNITVKQIMRGRLDVSGIRESSSLQELVTQVSELHYSRLPVYSHNLDQISGMIHTKDLLPYLDDPGDGNWKHLIRPPFFVHEQKLIEDLLREFQSRHIHFAIVVDEFGGTSGIVTLEDILEEVIGDIRDEFDEEDQGFQRLDDHTYILDGKLLINDLCRMLGIPPETFDPVRGESDSVGGLILELAGEFPESGRVIPCMNYEFTVLEVGKMRIRKLRMRIPPARTENPPF